MHALTLISMILVTLSASSVNAAPTPEIPTGLLLRRNFMTDHGPGNLQGDDLDDWNKCASRSQNEVSCYGIGNAAYQIGCSNAMAAQMKPCKNKAVQARLTELHCAENPGDKGC